MSAPVFIDAGPALNFLSISQERVLLSVVGGYICAPETVAAEVEGKARRDQRFAPAKPKWTRLQSVGRIEILSDDVTPPLSAAAERISGVPLDRRKRQAKDLGELMVVAHAAVRAEAGQNVIVLIDEGDGAKLARLEAKRLERRKGLGHRHGSISVHSTLTILAAAAGTEYVPDRLAMRRIYKAMAPLDDGLPRDIEQTDLLSQRVWTSGTAS